MGHEALAPAENINLEHLPDWKRQLELARPQLEVEPAPVTDISEARLGRAEKNRAEFLERLITAGTLSREYAESGQLERFDIDADHRFDAVSHILVGDRSGGAHHMRTMQELGVTRTETPARVREENGAYLADPVWIHTPDGGQLKKLGGSAMFPDEWTAEQVLKAVVHTADQPARIHRRNKHAFVHYANVDGVRVKVITDDKTGKIITACPNI